MHGRSFRVARASRADVPELVLLLADDAIGSTREGADLTPYLAAFEAIDRDPAQLLVTVRDEEHTVGTMQLTLIPGLSRSGALRLQIEAVRVAASARGVGLGTALLEWAATYGRERGASLVQLTTDKQRSGAHRFYESLGYVASHEGFKLHLG